MNAAVEAGLRRHRTITLAALAVMTLLAWAWLLNGAGLAGDEPGMGMQGMEAMAAPAPAAGFGALALTFAMWWTMMVAMMVPAAAPTVLLYARAAARPEAPHPPSGAFLAGYLLVWGLVSLLAASLQLWLEQAARLSPVTMALDSARLSGGVLIAAGLYQLSPLKDSCLQHCRNPAQFLARYYRPGAFGALGMGMRHGMWCLGCCWMLMALLFVGGVMNLAWVAALTLLVAAEKLLPFGRWVARLAGVACLAGGAWLLLMP